MYIFNPNCAKSWNERLLNSQPEQDKAMHDDPMEIDSLGCVQDFRHEKTSVLHQLSTGDNSNNGEKRELREQGHNDKMELMHNKSICENDGKNIERAKTIDSIVLNRTQGKFKAPFDLFYGLSDDRPERSLLSDQLIDENCNKSAETSKFNFQVLNDELEVMYEKKMTDDDQQETERIERWVIFEIESMRRRYKAPFVNVSKNLTETAKSLSKSYCVQGESFEGKRPFEYLSYTFKRHPGQSPKYYANMLSRHWLERKPVIRELSNNSLTEFAVGVWASSESVVISVLTHTPLRRF